MMTAEENVKMHKEAFRAAFDFLNTHFPPGLNPEWWIKAAKDASEVCGEHKENCLAVLLISGVYDYLDSKAKEMGYSDGSEY